MFFLSLKLSQYFLFIAAVIALPSSISSMIITTTAGAVAPSSTAPGNVSGPYTIFLENLSGDSNTYTVFQPDSQPSVWANPWFTIGLANLVSLRIFTTTTYWGYTGFVPSTPAPGKVVTVRDNTSTPVDQGSVYGTKVVNDTLLLVEPPQSYNAPPGSFAINTGADFSSNNNFVLGVETVNPITNSTVPVITVPALPNIGYTFTPGNAYFVTTGIYKIGELVAIDTQSQRFGVCNFTLVPGFLRCSIVQSPDGSYSVTYS